MVLRNLGLYNAKDTIVGNNSVRGVSGGERRRVTMGERTTAVVVQRFCFVQVVAGQSILLDLRNINV